MVAQAKQTIKVFIMCGGYYENFDYPKSLTKINNEALVDRTIRLLSRYDVEAVVCCNEEETIFDDYNVYKAKFTFDYLKQTGYYLDVFDAIHYDEPCIYLFGDVYYSDNAIKEIIDKFNNTNRNIFICNEYPFNKEHLRQGEPFGWIVKDQQEFKSAITLCKKFQDRNVIDHANGIPSNWELAHIINGLGVNDFNLRRDDCLVINDVTIDIDEPHVIETIEKRVNNDV